MRWGSAGASLDGAAVLEAQRGARELGSPEEDQTGRAGGAPGREGGGPAPAVLPFPRARPLDGTEDGKAREAGREM